jgi:outer membrane protein OmpA-like peptidoglycan-associated protein
MQWEVGGFVGLLFPNKLHNLRDDKSAQQPYTSPALDLGLRVGFLPIKYVGLEVEGAVAPTTVKTGGAATLFAARAHVIGQLPIGRITPFLLVGGGKMGGASRSMGTDIDPAFHFGLGAKYAITEGFGVRLDVRDNMTQKASTLTSQAKDGDQVSHWEVLLGASFALECRHEKEEAAPPPPRDSDGDGFLDDKDKCPMQPGIAPDGCPDKDSDGDTVLDSKDACPLEPGPASLGGCPVRDTDKDGIPDDYDKCPTEPGPINGCPDLDPDHDGIPVPADKCPDQPETKNGFDDDDGCPDEIPEKVRKFTGVVKGIEFDTGKDTIRPISEAVLTNALAIFSEFPKMRIEVSGHTDDVGQHDDNVTLSKKRAESVKNWFVGKGVDPSRIETRGAGPDEPIAPNKGPDGRQKNRRIEFKLLQ